MRNMFVSTLLASSLFSATFNVNSITQLRQALEDAAMNGENDIIILAPGRYKVMDDEIGTFTFNDNEEFNLTIEGAAGHSREEIVLDGEEKKQVLNLQNQKFFTVTLKNLTIVNGKGGWESGGVYTSGDIIIKNCIISNNSASNGGGFYHYGNVVVTNSIFSNNSGEYSGGGFYNHGNAVVTNSTFSNNSANYGDGGGFYNYGNAVVTNSTFSNNSVKYDGGGFCNKNGWKGNVVVTNSTFSNNNAANGGGFYNHENASNYENTVVTNSTFSNNSAKYQGGGFFNYGNAVVINSTFSDNSDRYSGGGFSSGMIEAFNNTFVSSPVNGYGIFINNIFVDGGIDFYGDSKLFYNYIDYKYIEENGRVILKKHNLQPSRVGDIRLADDNISLLSGSPAIDAGLNPDTELFRNMFDNNDTYQEILNYLKTDYFGHQRVVNGVIDLGAMEYGARALNNNAPLVNISVNGAMKIYIPIEVNISIEAPNGIQELYIDKGDGYEQVDASLRSFTVTFKTPGEHTIKIKVVDKKGIVIEKSKTLTIQDLNTQEAIEYGKKLCKKDPASCGITGSNEPKEEIIFITPKEHLVSILSKQSTFPVAGYFVHYNDPQSINPSFDWLYILVSGEGVYKLQGMKRDGHFSWSDNLADQFSSITISSDGKYINFIK